MIFGTHGNLCSRMFPYIGRLSLRPCHLRHVPADQPARPRALWRCTAAENLWLARQGGQVADVLALSHAGLVLPVLPSASSTAPTNVLAGRSVKGIVGRQDWARGMARACGLTGLQPEP